MLEGPRTYPLLRDRRKRRVRSRAKGLWRAIAVGMASIGVVLTIALVARYAAAPDPIAELAAARAAYAGGDYSAARRHAQLAADADPRSAPAQLALASASLAMGDGTIAEGALTRAVAAGADRAKLNDSLAEAYLQQGDTDRALAQTEGYPLSRIRAKALAASRDYPEAAQILDALVARSPNRDDLWIDIGRLRLAAGDIGGADLAGQRAVALDRRDPAALTLRGELVRARYGLNAALPWFAAALARDPGYHPALIEQAATLGDLGRYRAMLAATRRALAAKPGSPQALYLQAVMAARTGRIELARTLLTKTGGAIDATPGVVLLDGALSYAAGDYERAVARWRELVARQPMNVVARRLLGAALLRSGDARGALDILRPVALRGDADSYTLTLVGRAFEATGERDWAARFLDRAQRPMLDRPHIFASDTGVEALAGAVADAPGDPAAVVAYARGLIDSGDYAAALAQAQNLATASPGAPAAQMLVGDVFALQGRSAPALAAYLRAADLRFDTPVLLRIGELASAAAQPKAAATALALFLTQDPTNIVGRRVLANTQLVARDWPRAIATLSGLRATLGNRDALVLAQLAYASAGDGDGTSARRYARAAYRLAPSNPATADAYGWALRITGENGAALQLLTKAADIAPAHAGIRWHLAQALADAGRRPEARAAIAVALRDPAFQDSDAAAALLRSLGT